MQGNVSSFGDASFFFCSALNGEAVVPIKRLFSDMRMDIPRDDQVLKVLKPGLQLQISI